MDDKVILTNLSALEGKYGSANVNKILAAVKKLIAADKKRGIDTRLVALDDEPAMKELDAPHVAKATDPKQNKLAIDAVYKKLLPDYVLILGAIDVVPHQNMKNPVFNVEEDLDRYAFGDLPYACEAPYSQKPQDFLGATRVVGRLPDLRGGTDPSYLVGLLQTAASWTSSPPEDYAECLGVSAEVWKISTNLSLKALFGAGNKCFTSPKGGPKWTAAQLKKRVHFINCHGAEADFHFYGEDATGDQPFAHDASHLDGKISEGTVVAAECCYGAELYDPSLADGQAGICNTYLANKAYGFLGSTTIAYGPPEETGSADLICQFFIRHVLEGASLGRAALAARQEFAQSSPALDPVDLKTLAQFNLYGDPSVTPVASSPTTPHAVTKSLGVAATSRAMSINRAERREQLASRGMWLAQNQPVASERRAGTPSAPVVKTLARMAAAAGITPDSVMTFDVKRPRRSKQRGAAARGVAGATTPSAATSFHVLVERKSSTTAPAASASSKKSRAKAIARNLASGTEKSPVIRLVALVAKEVNGEIVSVRELHSR